MRPRRGKKERTGDVISPPKEKTRVVGLFLSGLRSISMKLIHARINEFKEFILELLDPFFKAWKIHRPILHI